jgi:hypothetical protein
MSKSAPAPLTIPGLPRKGEAVPAVESLEPAPVQTPHPPIPAAVAVVPPAPAVAPPALPQPAAPPVLPPSAKVRATIAVTVRLDEARYERLKSYGGKHRVTNQDIIVAALDRFLGTD